MSVHRPRPFALLTIIIFIASQVIALQSKRSDYPSAKRVDHSDRYHGVAVSDPYRWMEDMNSEETFSWVKAQDERLKDFVKNVASRDAIYKRLLELGRFESYSAPIKENGRYFFVRTESGSRRPVLYVQDGLRAKPQVLLDTEERFKGEDVILRGFAPSPDGRLVLCSLSKKQSRWVEQRLIDATSGDETAEEISPTHVLAGNATWRRDSKGFFYTRFEKPKSNSEQNAVVSSPKIYYHAWGSPNDSLVYAPGEKPNLLMSHTVTNDGRYLVITVNEGSSNKNILLYKDLSSAESAIKTLIGEADANYTFLGNEGERFWLYTDLNASRGRIIAINITKPERAQWKEVVPQMREAVAANSAVGGNALGMFGDRFLLMYLKDNNPLLRVFDKRGRLSREMALPAGGLIWGGFSGRQDDPEVFYRFLGITDQGSIHHLDIETGKSDVFRLPELKFDRKGITVKQVFYKSKDGTRVPMFIAHKEGIKLDGNNPVYLYGYGAFGWVSFLWYQPFRLAWMEMGGVYAIPGIRGGGEYGEGWHQAGMKLNKQNSIDDYLAAAQWLITNRYTSPERLVANGGSASAALAAAAIIQRPHLFGAAVIDIPLLDLIRYDKYTGAGYFAPEFGSPADPQEFKALYTYSPYHNLKKGQCYPPTLVMVGFRDQTAVPFHSYKFTAAMQYAQACASPVLMKVMWGAGHNFGATPEETADSFADELAFLYRTLKMGDSNGGQAQRE